MVTEYVWLFLYNLAQTLFWNPRTNGCSAACPANLLMADGSNRVLNTISTIGIFPSLAISVIVLALIVRHWQSARGWSRRAIRPLVVISFAVVTVNVLQNVADVHNLPVSAFVLWMIGSLLLFSGPALVVLSLTRARTAAAAVRTALVDLEPGPAPDRLRDALAERWATPPFSWPSGGRTGLTTSTPHTTASTQPDPRQAEP